MYLSLTSDSEGVSSDFRLHYLLEILAGPVIGFRFGPGDLCQVHIPLPGLLPVALFGLQMEEHL